MTTTEIILVCIGLFVLYIIARLFSLNSFRNSLYAGERVKFYINENKLSGIVIRVDKASALIEYIDEHFNTDYRLEPKSNIYPSW